MTLQQIVAADIARWNSLEDIASTFKKRDLTPRPDLGEDHQLPLQLDDDEFIVLVEAGPGENARDFKPDNMDRHTNLVATNDFDSFTFIKRVRTWDQQHGRIKYQKLSFEKEQFERDSGEKNTILQKLNSIEYGSSAAIYGDLYDTKRVVKEFYDQFEDLRTDLVQEVANIPDDRGEAKQRYVHVVLDRMIFLYFIQEKRLLDYDTDYLRDRHDEVVDQDDNVYEEFYRPLFFEMLGEGKEGGDFFGKLPYLNGGLFSKNPVEEKFEDARLGKMTEETNELFEEILNFLSDWNWNVDERLDIVDPKNLSPEVLGHIFEQTVNQKEMGAYYTPEEITGFVARRTIHPYLLDQLNGEIEVNYDSLDGLFGFTRMESGVTGDVAADGGSITQQAPTQNIERNHVEALYFDILKDAKILDPAVGSGAFLLAAQEVLLDIYMQCIEYFQQVQQEMPWELSSRIKEELETISEGQGTGSLHAKREIILNNLYGVDIDDGAVEICKLRLWLSMVADIEDEPEEVEPLPNIDFNIRQGNSLIGFVNDLEAALDDMEEDEKIQATIGSFGENSVKRAVKEINEAIEKHKEATSSEEATKWRHEANERLEKYREVLNNKTAKEFRSAVDADVLLEKVKEYSPFHWVIEFPTVFQDGGFDVAIGNPPWDKVKAERTDFFPRYDEVFRARSDDEKDTIQNELLEDKEIEQEWRKYQADIDLEADYYKESPTFKLQKAVVDGRTLSGDQEKSTMFLERLFSLVQEDGYVAQLFPGILFSGGSNKSLRYHLLEDTNIQHIVGFENSGIFETIDNRKKFAIVNFKASGKSEGFDGVFMKRDVDFLRNIDEHLVWIPKELLVNYAPESGLFPFIRSETHRDVLETLLRHPQLRENQDDTWYLDLYRELDRTADKDRFVTDPDKGDYPIFAGNTIYQFIYNSNEPDFWSVDEKKGLSDSAKWRIREKDKKNLKTAIYESFDGSGSQKGFVNDLLEKHRGKPLQEEDVLLDCTEYRMVYRHATSPTNERSLLVAVIPKGVVCHNALTTMRPYEMNPSKKDLSEDVLHDMYDRIFTDRELFAAAGLLNSIPTDYLMKSKVEENINMFHLLGTQVPRLTEGDKWFDYISERAARLSCYGDQFAEMRERLGHIDSANSEEERRKVQAELDAAAFHACGLNEKETKFVLEDFNRVENPRMMDEEYFEMVLKNYRSFQSE